MNQNGLIYRLRVFHGMLHEKRLEMQRAWRIWRYMTFPLGEKVYLLGTPEHTNLGDSAIVLAQKHFLQQQGIPLSRIKEISFSEYYRIRSRLRRFVDSKSLICLLGGGNMGNQWPEEERFRFHVLEDFPRNPVVVFPQTVYYVPQMGQVLSPEESAAHYNDRPGLTLGAREQTSYEMMSQLFRVPVVLAPDMVLSMNMTDFGVASQKRQGVLLCIRKDAEKTVPDDVWQTILQRLSSAWDVRITDTHAEQAVTVENRAELVRRKMTEFAAAQLVVTDRLHGMIFAAITGTPCIVFGNYNHKVRGSYDWISYLPYVKYVETVEEALSVLPELLAMEECVFDNGPLKPYFDALEKVVKSYVH